jgi:hypothetical protein
MVDSAVDWPHFVDDGANVYNLVVRYVLGP